MELYGGEFWVDIFFVDVYYFLNEGDEVYMLDCDYILYDFNGSYVNGDSYLIDVINYYFFVVFDEEVVYGYF